MSRVVKIITSWVLVLAGVYFISASVLDYYSARKAQTAAAESWKESNPGDETISDEPVLPASKSFKPELSPKMKPRMAPVGPGSSVARLSIPRLDAQLYVVEGTDKSSLRRGPGHMPGTELPGGPGNCVIAGHRDTHFRVLQNIRKGDEIVLESRGSEYRYRVTDLSVIAPTNTRCLNPTKQAVLNLITCYPFHYVGPAPKRFIVHADLETAPERAQSGI